MKTTTTSLAVALFLAAGTLTACGSGENGPVVLRYSWWGTPERAALVEQVITRYEATHPGVDVQGSYADYDAYWQKLSTEAAGGGAPDVIQMDFSYLREYADKGILLDLGPHTGRELHTGDLLPGLAESGQVADGTYAVPVSANTYAVAYDKQALAAAGIPAPAEDWSWADFAATAGSVTGAGGRPGATDFSLQSYVLEAQLIQQGREFYTKDGRLGFSTAELAKFWADATQQRAGGHLVPPERSAQVAPASPLSAGQSAMEFCWDNMLDAVAAQSKADLGLAPVPSGGPESAQYLKPSQMLAGYAGTEHPERAAEFIDFLINDPGAGEVMGANRGLPATRAQRAAAKLDGTDATIAAFEESIADRITAPPPAPPAGAGSLELTFRRLAENVAYGRQTPQAAAEEFTAEADSLLRR